jgi:uncharacterized protein (DUF58 family)
MPRWATRWRPSRCRAEVRPTGRTVALAALAALSALVLPAELAAALLVAVVVVFGADAVSVRRPPEVVRVLPEHVVRGVPQPWRAEVRRSSGRAPGRVVVRQPQTGEVRFDPAEGEGIIEGEVVAVVRGDHPVPALVTATTGRLGLGAWVHQHEGAAGRTLLGAHADLPGARRLAIAVQEGRFDDPGTARGALGLGTDFESVRDYAPDDDIRRMNWKATERTGRPMVNQYREDTEREVWCLVDTGRLLASPVGDRTRLDLALDAVAAVAAVAEVVGDRVGMVVFDDEVRRVVPPRRGAAAGLVRLLDPLQPSVRDTDFEGAFARVGASKRALVLVFTDLLDVAAARPLLAAVPVLVRRHAVVVATVTDPDVEAAVAPGIDGVPADPARAAVAADLLADRRRVGVRLEAAGARVVEAPADRLPAACVAAYLALKASARL